MLSTNDEMKHQCYQCMKTHERCTCRDEQSAKTLQSGFGAPNTDDPIVVTLEIHGRDRFVFKGDHKEQALVVFNAYVRGRIESALMRVRDTFFADLDNMWKERWDRARRE